MGFEPTSVPLLEYAQKHWLYDADLPMKDIVMSDSTYNQTKTWRQLIAAELHAPRRKGTLIVTDLQFKPNKEARAKLESSGEHLRDTENTPVNWRHRMAEALCPLGRAGTLIVTDIQFQPSEAALANEAKERLRLGKVFSR